MRCQASSLEEHFGGARRRIALEAGGQSAWIARELTALGHEVIVANARQLKWITASDTKNDPADARKLALLARADVRLLAPVEHRTAAQRLGEGRRWEESHATGDCCRGTQALRAAAPLVGDRRVL